MRIDLRHLRPGALFTRIAAALLLAVCTLGAGGVAAAQQPLQMNMGTNLGTYAVGEIQLTLFASGGTGTYTWSVTGGALPPGMHLFTDGPNWNPNLPSLSGVVEVTTPTTFSFALTVSDGVSSVSRNTQLRVTPLAVAEYWELPAAHTNRFYSYQLQAVNNSGPVTWSANGSLPPGLTLSPTGLLSGTPTSSNFWSVNLSLRDGVDSVGRGLSLPIYDIEILPVELPNAEQNVPYTTTIQASGGTAPYTFSYGFLPTDFTLDPVTGVLSGTLTGPGRYGLEIRVTDANGIFRSRNLIINAVSDPSMLPWIGSGLSDGCTVGVPCSRNLWPGAGGRPPFTWSATGLPEGMRMRSGYGNISYWLTSDHGEIVGAPAASGDYSVTVTLTDADGLTSSNVFPFHISTLHPTYYPPSGTIAVPYTSRLRVIGGVRPLAVSVVEDRLPEGVTFDPATLVISGTPRESGWFHIRIRHSDATGDSLTTWYSLYIAGPGTSTIQISDFYDLGTTNVGSSYFRQLTACCVPSYAWSIIDGALPPGLTLSESGLLSGVPNTVGTYKFLVRVQDATFAANFAVRQFIFTVAQPTTSFFVSTASSLPFGNVGTPYGLTLEATGGTAPLTWALTNYHLPFGLTLGIDGVISGTPQVSGQYIFHVRATDATGRTTGVRSLSLFVYPAGQIPPLSLPLSFSPILTLGSVIRSQLQATGGVGPYTYSLSPGASTIPGLRVQNGQPLPTFFQPTTTGGYLGVLAIPGTYASSLRVTDSTGRTFDRRVAFRVTPLQVLSQSNLPRATVAIPYSFTLIPYGGAGTYTWEAPVLPPGLSLNPSTGEISGTPTTVSNSSYTIILRDPATAESLNAFISVQVQPFAIVTSGVLPKATVGVAYEQTLSAPNCGAGCVWTSLGLPTGLTINSATGVISGTPTFSIDASTTIQATGANGTAQKLFSLLIVPALPQFLTITTNSGIQSTVGSSFNLRLQSFGGTGPYTWSVVDGMLPPGMRLEGPGEALSSFTVAGSMYLNGRTMVAGTYNFALGVTDALGSTALRSVSWSVTPLQLQYFSLPIPGRPLVYNTPYSQPLLVIGGTGVYTWTATGAMPPGLSLDSATGIVSGTPTNTGFFSVPMTVTDSGGNVVVGSISFNIAGEGGTTISLSLGSLALSRGSNFSSLVGVSGGTAPYTVTAVTPLPPGFALLSGDALSSGNSPGSYLIAGIATAPGSFTFTLEATDAVGNRGVRTFFATVTDFSLLSSTALRDGVLGAAYSQALITGGVTGPVSWALAANSTLPPGLSVSAAGLISGTPTAAGSFSFVLTASSGAGPSRTFTFSLLVTPLSFLDAAILPSATQGVPYAFTFSAAGGGPARVWSVTGLPDGLSMSTGGSITGTPTDDSGSLVLAVTVSDGAFAASRRFALFVLPGTPEPLDYGLLQAAHFTVGQRVTLQVHPSGGTPPYTVSVAPGSLLPPGLQLLPAGALSSFDNPAAPFVAGVVTTAGSYAFDLIIRDAANAELRRTFTLKVTAVGLPPISPPTAVFGVPYAFRFTPIGGVGPYTFSMAAVSQTQEMLPPGLAMSPTGTISGTPASTGSYLFRLYVQDATGEIYGRNFGLTANGTTGLRVTNVNPEGVTLGSGRSTHLLSVSGSSTYAWSVVAGALPPGLSLQPAAELGSPSGTMVTGRPTVAGTFVYTLRATDTANAANVADHVFTFLVSPLQLVSPPVGLAMVLGENAHFLPIATVGVPYSATLKAAGGAGPYTFTLVPPPVAEPLPPGLTLSSAGVLSGTPPTSGVFSISPVITDSTGRTFTSLEIYLYVAQAGTPPVMARNGGGHLPDGSAGSPYLVRLDAARLAGVGPYAWTLAPGSLMPAGLALLTGGNGVSDHLGGAPQAPGAYTFTLLVTDANGQSITVPLRLNVTAVTLAPLALAPGRVGTPYSASLVPTGGIAPYTVELWPDADMPPGLTLDGALMLRGTPTGAGHFVIGVNVTDAAGNTLGRAYPITIDDGLGNTSAVSLTPTPVHLTYTLNRPAPAAVVVHVGVTSGAVPTTLALAGIPGATLSSSAGTAPFDTTISLAPAGLTAGTYHGMLGVSAPQTSNGFDSVPVTLTVVEAPPCTFVLNPPSGTVAFNGSGSFSVATAAGCQWSAVSGTPSWLIVTKGATGNGPGSVSFSTAPNTSPSPRVGTINVGGTSYTLTQFGTTCSFAVGPTAIAATSAGGVAEVTITASARTCAWTAFGLDVSLASGTGSAKVSLLIPPNPAPGSRTLNATVASQLITITQTGIDCTAALAPASASYLAEGGSGSVVITTPAACAYSTVTGPSWITVSSGASGTGGGTLNYVVDTNSSTSSRSGSLTIGGVTFPISQAGRPCSFTLDTSALGAPYGPASGAGSIGITANGTDCQWTATSPAPWLSLSPASGTGTGTILVNAPSNEAATDARSTLVTIAGQTVPVTQAGTICTYKLQSTAASVPAGGGSGSAGVIAPSVCGWTASSDSPWLQITQTGAAGTGDVQFLAQPNSSPLARTGILTIAALAYTVTQAGAPCSYTLAFSNAAVASTGVAGAAFGFSTAAAGCAPAAVSYASWISVSTSFAGNAGTVTYSATPNPLTTTRSGTIQVGDRTFTVNQTGGLCAYSLHEYGAVFGKGGGTGSIFGSLSALGCTPGVAVDQPNIVTLGLLSGPLNNIFTQPYTVAASPINTTTRIARIDFGGRIFVVKQVSW